MENGSTTSRSNLQLKSLILAAVFIIGGLCAMIVEQVIKKDHSTVGEILGELASVLLVGGLWSAAYEFTMRRDFISATDESIGRLERKFSLADQESAVGLSKVLIESSTYDYSDLLLNSKRLVVLLNDGRTWVSLHGDKLRRRFGDPSKETVFFLLHPGHEMMSVLSRKVGTAPDALRQKIKETVSMLAELGGRQSKFFVWGHKLFNPHSLFLGDEYAVLTTYLVSRGRGTVPLFIFDRSSSDNYYSKLNIDMEQLKQDSELLWPKAEVTQPVPVQVQS